MPRITHLSFPELQLQARDGHKLRGWFGNLFKEKSPLLHNHLEGGELIYRYPLVQYKVIDGTPLLVGINEGAELLIDLFLQIRELDIDGTRIPLQHKQLDCKEVNAGYADRLFTYQFKTLYLALNQKNYASYQKLDSEEKKEELNRLLRSHILAAFKGMGIWLEPHQRVLTQVWMKERSTQLKNQRMLAFLGKFTTNVWLPNWIGLGKSTSRGFGAVEAISD